jgi:2EXR family
MFSSLPVEIQSQIWAWVCHDEAIEVRCKHQRGEFSLIDTPDTLNLRLILEEQAAALIHKHAILDFESIHSIETLKRVFNSPSADKLRSFRRIRMGYYGLFCVMRSVAIAPFDCVYELQLQCVTRYWPPIEPEIALEDVRDPEDDYERRDGPLLWTRYSMAKLKMADDAVVRLVRCIVVTFGCEKPTGITFLVKPNAGK